MKEEIKWNKEAKDYFKKRIPRLLMIVGFLVAFGIINLAHIVVSGSWVIGGTMLGLIGIPSAVAAIIYLLLLGRKCDELSTTEA